MSASFLSDTAWDLIEHAFKFGLGVQTLSYLLVPVGAIFAFRQQRARQQGEPGLRGFLRYCMSFDSSSPWTAKFRSLRLDIGFIIVKKFVTDWVLVPILFTSAITANVTYHLLAAWFGAQAQITPGWLTTCFVVGIAVVVSDFVQFMVHYVHHHNKTLWDVHKVHHSVEFLAFSFSAKRTHAIEEALNTAFTAGIVGIVVGILCYGLSIPVWDSLIYGVDAWFLLQLASFWHLRHSHMSLSYGRMEHVFQSPAQHQLHHSAEARHRGKNFGLLFSFWDKLFNCFELSDDPATFRVGLAERDRGDYNTVFKLYATPVRNMAVRFYGVVRSPTERPATPSAQAAIKGQTLPQPGG